MTKITTLIVITVSLLATISCNSKNNEETKKTLKTYKVLKAKPTNTTLIMEYPASLKGIVDVEIRSKIDGYIDKIFVDEGQEVITGQILFRIHNPQFAQDVKSLEATVTSAQAAVASAELQVTKTQPLVKQGIISNFELTNAQLTLDSRRADLQRAKANLSNAITNVGYTEIKSPINGVVGTIAHRIGSYVSNATIEPLTQISDISTIYAYFSISEKQQLQLSKELEGETFQKKIDNIAPVNLVLTNGERYEYQGKIQMFSGQVNTQTGAFNVRADFPNTKKMLRSGNSATIQIPTHLENVIVIPQKATVELQDKRMAYVLIDNKVTAVAVKVRPTPDGKFFVVDEGIKENDKVVIEGIGILTEGTEIEPKFVQLNDLMKQEDIP